MVIYSFSKTFIKKVLYWLSKLSVQDVNPAERLINNRKCERNCKDICIWWDTKLDRIESEILIGDIPVLHSESPLWNLKKNPSF